MGNLFQISRNEQNLKKKLKVTFAGEPGLDMGGLTKEWFLLLIRKIFQQDYGMFSYDSRSQVFWFNPGSSEALQEFRLVGVLMGLAVYNCINLDIRFPPVCYRKLLNPAVVPYSKPEAVVGVAHVSLEDLKMVMPVSNWTSLGTDTDLAQMSCHFSHEHLAPTFTRHSKYM